MSSCTDCHRVRCLTTENVFHMNSEKTATSQSCYLASLFSALFFFLSVQIIFSRIFYCFFFFVSLEALAIPYLTVKFCSNHV